MKKLLLSLLLVGGAAYSQSWVPQATAFPDPSRGILELDIVDANTVWCLAYDGMPNGADFLQEFTRTTDGGETWTPGLVEMFDPDLTINGISAVNGTTAFVNALNEDIGLGGFVFKTSDGGESWNNANPSGYISETSFLNMVYFWNENVGITQGDPVDGAFEVYRTTTGGSTGDDWTAVTGLPAPLDGEYGYNGGNVGAGTRFWFVTNKGRIFRTDDMGLTYTAIQMPFLTDFAGTNVGGSLFMSDNNTGFVLKRTGTVAAGTYTIYRTFDGGTTWSASAPWTGGVFRLLAYIPGTTTIVGCSQGTPSGSQYSPDNGATWVTIDSGEQRGNVAMFDATTGWCGGFNEDESTGGIFKLEGSLGVNIVPSTKLTAVPNPTNGILTISNENSAINEVTAFNLLGKQVYTKKFSALTSAEVDLSALSTGAYMVRVTDAAGANEVIKVVKN